MRIAAQQKMRDAWKQVGAGDSLPAQATPASLPAAAQTAQLRTDAVSGGSARVAAASRAMFHAATGRAVR